MSQNTLIWGNNCDLFTFPHTLFQYHYYLLNPSIIPYAVPYGVPFSHVFTELQISAIDLQISPNEL